MEEGIPLSGTVFGFYTILGEDASLRIVFRIIHNT
jgi:hypothetical protein